MLDFIVAARTVLFGARNKMAAVYRDERGAADSIWGVITIPVIVLIGVGLIAAAWFVWSNAQGVVEDNSGCIEDPESC